MRWRTWKDIHGVKTEVAFDHSSGPRRLLVRQTVHQDRLNQYLVVNRESYDQNRIKELARGNTQAHKIPIASLPAEIYYRWRRELGDYRRDPDAAKRWLIRLNDHTFREFRTAEGHL